MPITDPPSTKIPPELHLATQAEKDAINAYLAQKPDFDQYIKDAKAGKTITSTTRIETEYDRNLRAAVKEIVEERRAEAKAQIQAKKEAMPDQQGEGKNRADQATQGSKTSQPTKASIEHHQANPGPVMTQNLPEPASKEELRKRAEELNKKS